MNYNQYPQPDPGQDDGGGMAIPIIVIIITLLMCALARAEITGPERLSAGELGIYKLDAQSVVNVFPVEYQDGLYIDSNGLAFCFASAKPGLVTIVASSVQDGKPAVEYIIVNNGGGIDDNDPFPPSDLTQAVIDQADKITSPTKQADIDALAKTFTTVADMVDAGRITSPQQARETFRIQWTQSAIGVSATTANTWQAAISALSLKVDNTTVKTISADYREIAKALKEGI